MYLHYLANVCSNLRNSECIYPVAYIHLTKSAHQCYFPEPKTLPTRKFLLLLFKIKGKKLLIVFEVSMLSVIAAI